MVNVAYCNPCIITRCRKIRGLAIELHLPHWLPAFILANLFFVSLAEEALFRGVIQQTLSRYLPPYVALLIAPIIFGFAHFAGGVLLVIFASLAGLFMAWLGCGVVGFGFQLRFILRLI